MLLAVLAVHFELRLTGQDFLTNGLVAYYPFNGDSRDGSGGGNDFVLTYGSFSDDRHGRAVSSVRFHSGQSDQDTFTIKQTLSGGSISIAFDVRREWMQGQQGSIIIRIGSESASGKQIQAGLDYSIGNVRWTFFFDDLDLPYKLSTSAWSHFVFTYNKETGIRSVYQDGELIGSGPSRYAFTGNSIVTLGLTWGAYSLDNLRIYNRAIPAEEVDDLYRFETGPSVEIEVAIKLTQHGLVIGSLYQLQKSSNLIIWSDFGTPFTATSSLATNYVDAEESITFWRLKPIQ